jgi:hypothetical protein
MDKEILLWKYDKHLGIAFFCPNCKKFVCGNEKKCECGQELDWNKDCLDNKEYKGKVEW